MKNKSYLLAVFSLLLTFALAQAADQLVILADGDNVSGADLLYTVPADHVAEIEALALHGASAQLWLDDVRLPAAATLSGKITVGAGVRVRASALTSDEGSIAFAQLRVRELETGSGYLPQNTVVIPTDAGGPVQILLESSIDLLTWSPVSPGTYGASTASRFFRVRAELVAE